MSMRTEIGRGDNTMHKVVTTVLLAIVWAGVAQAQGSPAKGPSAAEAVKQAEHNWVDAAKAGDADKLGQILADDCDVAPEKWTLG